MKRPLFTLLGILLLGSIAYASTHRIGVLVFSSSKTISRGGSVELCALAYDTKGHNLSCHWSDLSRTEGIFTPSSTSKKVKFILPEDRPLPREIRLRLVVTCTFGLSTYRDIVLLVSTYEPRPPTWRYCSTGE